MEQSHEIRNVLDFAALPKADPTVSRDARHALVYISTDNRPEPNIMPWLGE